VVEKRLSREELPAAGKAKSQLCSVTLLTLLRQLLGLLLLTLHPHRDCHRHLADVSSIISRPLQKAKLRAAASQRSYLP
jgi:hypothetical protein